MCLIRLTTLFQRKPLLRGISILTNYVERLHSPKASINSLHRFSFRKKSDTGSADRKCKNPCVEYKKVQKKRRKEKEKQEAAKRKRLEDQKLKSYECKCVEEQEQLMKESVQSMGKNDKKLIENMMNCFSKNVREVCKRVAQKKLCREKETKEKCAELRKAEGIKRVLKLCTGNKCDKIQSRTRDFSIECLKVKQKDESSKKESEQKKHQKNMKAIKKMVKDPKQKRNKAYKVGRSQRAESEKMRERELPIRNAAKNILEKGNTKMKSPNPKNRFEVKIEECIKNEWLDARKVLKYLTKSEQNRLALAQRCLNAQFKRMCRKRVQDEMCNANKPVTPRNRSKKKESKEIEETKEMIQERQKLEKEALEAKCEEEALLNLEVNKIKEQCLEEYCKQEALQKKALQKKIRAVRKQREEESYKKKCKQKKLQEKRDLRKKCEKEERLKICKEMALRKKCKEEELKEEEEALKQKCEAEALKDWLKEEAQRKKCEEEAVKILCAEKAKQRREEDLKKKCDLEKQRKERALKEQCEKEERIKKWKEEATRKKCEEEELKKEEESRKKKIEAEALKKRLEEEAQRKKCEEEAVKKVCKQKIKQRKEENLKKKCELERKRKERAQKEQCEKKERMKKWMEVAAKKKCEEEAAKKKQREEALKKKCEEEALRKKCEEEALRKKCEEEALRKKSEEEALKKKCEEKALRKKCEEEAMKKKCAKQALKNKCEEKAQKQKCEWGAQKKKCEEEDRNKDCDDPEKCKPSVYKGDIFDETHEEYNGKFRECLYKKLKCQDYQPGNKVSVIGSGSVGMACTMALLSKGVTNNVAIYDTKKDHCAAERLDLLHGSLWLNNCHVDMCETLESTKNSRVVVVTVAGKSSGNGSRLDEAIQTAPIIKEIMPPLVDLSPKAVFLIVSNPTDVMAWLARKVAKLPYERCFSPGCHLDGARFRMFIAKIVGVSTHSVHGFVLGEHGDSSVPLWSSVAIGGTPLNVIIPNIGTDNDKMGWCNIHKMVVDSSLKVTKGKGYTNWAIGLSVADIVSAIFEDSNRIISLSTNVEGLCGISDETFLSFPCIVNRWGLSGVIRPQLSDWECTMLKKSAQILLNAQRGVH